LYRGSALSQGRYLHRTTKYTEVMQTDIHASGRIRTHDPNVREGEDVFCLRPRGNYDRQIKLSRFVIK
jgi:hypothetical protein